MLTDFTDEDRRLPERLQFSAAAGDAAQSISELLQMWGRMPNAPEERAPVEEGHQYVIDLNSFRRRALKIYQLTENDPDLVVARDGLWKFSIDVGAFPLTSAADEPGPDAAEGDFLVLRSNWRRKPLSRMGEELRGDAITSGLEIKLGR